MGEPSTNKATLLR